MSLSADFERRVLDVHGQAGRLWLDGLPGLLEEIERRWQLQLGGPLEPLSYNYVAVATTEDGRKGILKASVPNREIDREAECLRSYAGRGAPHLWEFSSSLGAILVERVQPGHDLVERPDSEAVPVIVSVMKRLHRAPAELDKFPSVREWGRSFRWLKEEAGELRELLPPDLVHQAESAFSELIGSMQEEVLLHGDLHHENVLASNRQPWLAVDPKGVTGEPACEVGPFLRNPVPDFPRSGQRDQRLVQRLGLFSDLMGIDQSRLAAWGFALTVISAIWSLEDHGSTWQGAIDMARALQRLMSASS